MDLDLFGDVIPVCKGALDGHSLAVKPLKTSGPSDDKGEAVKGLETRPISGFVRERLANGNWLVTVWND